MKNICFLNSRHTGLNLLFIWLILKELLFYSRAELETKKGLRERFSIQCFTPQQLPHSGPQQAKVQECQLPLSVLCGGDPSTESIFHSWPGTQGGSVVRMGAARTQSCVHMGRWHRRQQWSTLCHPADLSVWFVKWSFVYKLPINWKHISRSFP